MDMKKMIGEFYDIESENHFHEAQTKMLSIALGADQASMLRAIAERFGKSLSSFAGEILHEAVEEAFLFLDQEDKDSLAAKADKETTEFLSKKGIEGDCDRWGYIARMFRETGISGDEILDDKAARKEGEE